MKLWDCSFWRHPGPFRSNVGQVRTKSRSPESDHAKTFEHSRGHFTPNILKFVSFSLWFLGSFLILVIRSLGQIKGTPCANTPEATFCTQWSSKFVRMVVIISPWFKTRSQGHNLSKLFDPNTMSKHHDSPLCTHIFNSNTNYVNFQKGLCTCKKNIL